MTAKVLVLAGYGLNCEEETLHAFTYCGLEGSIIHINDLIENPKMLDEFQILTVPGGFSYGDDTGSGNAFAQKMKLGLKDTLFKFVERDTLTLGICNGCQILANLGLVPGFDGKYGERKVAVTHNENARYQCRWVNLKVNINFSPWLQDIETMHIPVAHGEGRFMMDEGTLETLADRGQLVLQYEGRYEGEPAYGEFPYNPNGSMADIAGITDETGKVLALMPHPERGMFTWQRDDYAELKDKAQRQNRDLRETADGIALFQNAAEYFEVSKRKIAL